MRQDSKHNERIGLTKQNKWGDTMKIIEYINANNIIVEFQDEYKEKKKSRYSHFLDGDIVNPHILNCRIGQENFNSQGCLMKIMVFGMLLSSFKINTKQKYIQHINILKMEVLKIHTLRASLKLE